MPDYIHNSLGFLPTLNIPQAMSIWKKKHKNMKFHKHQLMTLLTKKKDYIFLNRKPIRGKCNTNVSKI